MKHYIDFHEDVSFSDLDELLSIAEDLKKKVEKLWSDKKLCEEYSKNCKDISFDTIDEYYEKIMKVYKNISVRRSIGGKQT